MEIWKPINVTDLSGYEISTISNIRNNTTKRNLKQKIKENGYVTICINKKSYPVHRLVALTFIENPENKLTVNHIDSNKHNNHVQNLEWATHQEQYSHSRKKSVNSSGKGVWKVDPNTNQKIKFYKTIVEAGIDINGKNSSFKNISTCARGLIKTAYGFKWQYDECIDLENELWKPFKLREGCKGTYYISNYGRIKNGKRLLKLSIDNNGYYTYSTKAIHRIVAMQFIPNPNNYDIVNHIDGNKLNNNVKNLEWTTYQGNAIHSITAGLRSNVKRVVQIDENNNSIKTYYSCSDAARELNTNASSVNKCCKGIIKSCGNGLRFRYENNNNPIKYVKNSTNNQNGKRVKINIYSRNNQLIETCNSILKTSRKYNVNPKTIIQHCEKRAEFPTLDYYFRYCDS
jgi:hypothetical protein